MVAVLHAVSEWALVWGSVWDCLKQWQWQWLWRLASESLLPWDWALELVLRLQLHPEMPH